MATIDYMICAYGPYSASATAGNGWSRDFLAGILTVPATPFFENIGKGSGYELEYACTILACIATVLVLAVYAIYYYGPSLRVRSPFALQLANARYGSVDEGGGGGRGGGRRVSAIHGLYGSTRRASKSIAANVYGMENADVLLGYIEDGSISRHASRAADAGKGYPSQP